MQQSLKAAVLGYVTRRSAAVIKVGVACVNVYVSRHLKKELTWVIDKRLRVISN